jgi:hypothetical protein
MEEKNTMVNELNDKLMKINDQLKINQLERNKLLKLEQFQIAQKEIVENQKIFSP